MGIDDGIDGGNKGGNKSKSSTYQPQRLTDIVGQHVPIAFAHALCIDPADPTRLKSNMPSLLLGGPPGVGKTSTVHALLKSIGNYWPCKFINASDERRMEDVRETIGPWMMASPPVGFPFKLLILEEADQLTATAQAAMKQLMSDTIDKTRCIFLCNHFEKFLEPILSRVTPLRYGKISTEDMIVHLFTILQTEMSHNTGKEDIISPTIVSNPIAEAIKENTESINNILRLIADASEGDMRTAISFVQRFVVVLSSFSAIHTIENIENIETIENIERVEQVVGQLSTTSRRYRHLLSLVSSYAWTDFKAQMKQFYWLPLTRLLQTFVDDQTDKQSDTQLARFLIRASEMEVLLQTRGTVEVRALYEFMNEFCMNL